VTYKEISWSSALIKKLRGKRTQTEFGGVAWRPQEYCLTVGGGLSQDPRNVQKITSSQCSTARRIMALYIGAIHNGYPSSVMVRKSPVQAFQTSLTDFQPGGTRRGVDPHSNDGAARMRHSSENWKDSNQRNLIRRLHECAVAHPGFEVITLEPETVEDAVGLQTTNDPFDMCVIATARSRGLPLITGDRDIIESNVVEIVW